MYFKLYLIITGFIFGACAIKSSHQSETRALKNEGFLKLDARADQNLYNRIVRRLERLNLDFAARKGMLNPAWPIADSTTVLLSRFGTPSTATFDMGGARGGITHLHEGIDIYRSTSEVSERLMYPKPPPKVRKIVLNPMLPSPITVSCPPGKTTWP